MQQLVDEVRHEFRLWFHQKIWLLALVPLVLTAGISYSASRSDVRLKAEQFEQLAQSYRAEGLDVSEALARPAGVTTASDGSQTIDNPLKYDFVELSNGVRAVEPTAMAGTALDLTTFLAIPLVFLLMGAWSAVVDRAHGTILWRAARTTWTNIPVAKLVTLTVSAFLAALAVALCGVAVGWVGELAFGSMRGVAEYPLIDPQARPLSGKLLMTTAVGAVFGCLGYVIGTVTGSYSWPMVICAVILLLVPYLGAWDPRNVLTVLSVHVYDFWGQFSLRPPMGMSVRVAIMYSAAFVAVLAVAFAWTSRRPRVH